ncbi:MAG: Hsp20/alpha crystallin family protein [Terriglobia bacterium]|nr:Hsp20/alpha crystallin family protein [Terriglobia bacterium]
MKRNRNGMFNWDPFREITQLQQQMNRLVQDVFGESAEGNHAMFGNGFAPATDIFEDEKILKLRIEIPGIQPGDIHITFDNGVLTVRGERKIPEGESIEHYIAMESPYGQFSRSFSMPNTIDPATLIANYVNGVLEIAVNKRAEARPKQIPIQMGSKPLGTGTPTEKAA